MFDAAANDNARAANDNAPCRRPVDKADIVSAVLLHSILLCGLLALSGVGGSP